LYGDLEFLTVEQGWVKHRWVDLGKDTYYGIKYEEKFDECANVYMWICK